LIAVVLIVIGLALIIWRNNRSAGSDGNTAPVADEMWTLDLEEVQLSDEPVNGRLNGWVFKPNVAIWRDTRLTLRQDGGTPEALRLEITFPLRGGELKPGKTFRQAANDTPFPSPVRILWRDEQNRNHSETSTAGYALWVRFTSVSKDRVEGQLYVALPDTAHSWAAGRFSAEVRTQIKPARTGS